MYLVTVCKRPGAVAAFVDCSIPLVEILGKTPLHHADVLNLMCALRIALLWFRLVLCGMLPLFTWVVVPIDPQNNA